MESIPYHSRTILGPFSYTQNTSVYAILTILGVFDTKRGEHVTGYGLGIRLSSVKEEKVNWWSKGRLAFGKLHILEGDPGVGKSTLIAHWAAMATTGQALFPGGESIDPAGVMLIGVEDGVADTVRPRIEAAGGNAGLVWLLDEIPVQLDDGSMGKVQFELPTHCDIVKEAIAVNGIKLVVIDPFADFLASDLSENTNRDVRAALGPLKDVAEETGCCVVVIRHLNKSGGTNALYRGGGSIGIVGKARIGLLLAEDPRDSQVRCIARAKGNLGKIPVTLQFRLVDAFEGNDDVAKLEWLGECELTADELHAGKVLGVEKMAEWDDATAWLRDILKDGSREIRDIQSESRSAGWNNETLDKARARLRVKRVKHGFGGKWSWELPGTRPVAFSKNGSHPPFPEDEAL